MKVPLWRTLFRICGRLIPFATITLILGWAKLGAVLVCAAIITFFLACISTIGGRCLVK